MPARTLDECRALGECGWGWHAPGCDHPSRAAARDGSRSCSWCAGPIAAGARRDARYCSTRCRQGAHRVAVRRVAIARDGSPLRLAYADPPYPGLAGYYRGHPDYAGEVDHDALLRRLVTFDGWALSTSADALPAILELAGSVARSCSAPAPRVAAWLRGRPVPHPSAAIVSAWEPVLYVPARTRRADPRETPTPDAILTRTPRRRSTLPSWVIGAKPPDFAVWLFGLLGARPGDSLADLFPGSGIIGRSWAGWSGEPSAAALRDGTGAP